MSPWPQSKGNNLFILWPVHKSLVLLLLLLFLKHVQHPFAPPFAPPVHCNTEGGGWPLWCLGLFTGSRSWTDIGLPHFYTLKWETAPPAQRICSLGFLRQPRTTSSVGIILLFELTLRRAPRRRRWRIESVKRFPSAAANHGLTRSYLGQRPPTTLLPRGITFYFIGQQ